MPQKDITSVNEHAFAMHRSSFSKIMATEREETGEILKKKNFYGGSRNKDASSIIRSRAIAGTKSSFTAKDGALSFQGTKDINDTRQALRRTRSGGAVVPPKVTHKKTLY
jgi:hypothetical protein